MVVIFRSNDLASAWRMYQGMFTGKVTVASHALSSNLALFKHLPEPLFTIATVLLLLSLSAVCVWWKNPHELQDRIAASPRYFFITLVCLMLSILFMNHVSEFIYFQF